MSATRLEIRDRARIRADQDASTFPTDAQYNYLINEALQDVWWDLLGAGFPLPQTEATVSATSPTVAASGPVGTVQHVFYVSGGTYTELKRLPEDRRAEMMSTTAGTPAFYELGTSLSGHEFTVPVFPTATGGNLLVRYIKIPTSLAGDATVYYGPPRSDELIVLRTAMKAMRKEGNDQGANQVAQEYAELQEKVVRMASWFDQRNGTTIRDVNPMMNRRDAFDYDID